MASLRLAVLCRHPNIVLIELCPVDGVFEVFSEAGVKVDSRSLAGRGNIAHNLMEHRHVTCTSETRCFAGRLGGQLWLCCFWGCEFTRRDRHFNSISRLPRRGATASEAELLSSAGAI